MDAMSAIPRFQYHLSHKKHYDVIITVGDDVIHCVKDVHNFYTALGYTDDIMDTGLCFDEYIWLEYQKEDSDKLDACLQAKLINYLIQYSSTFIKKYADHYEDWLGRCNEILRNDNDCTECIMHPGQRENTYANCMTPTEEMFYATNAF